MSFGKYFLNARDLAEQGKHSNLVVENEQIREKNAQTILHSTTFILKELSQTHATFSEEQILKCIQKRMNDNPVLSSFVFDSVLKSAHLVGQYIHENNRYATTEYRELESKALSDCRVASPGLLPDQPPRNETCEFSRISLEH